MPLNRLALVPLVLILLVFTAAASFARDHRVPSERATISEAVNACQAGDRVLVSPGTYVEIGIALKDGVTIEGLGASPADVVIDGDDEGRVLRAINLTRAAAVTNLTIRNGHAYGASYVEGSGGAILLRNCDVVLTRVHFVNNRATASGGAVRALGARPVFVDCEFRDNRSGQGGGAIDGSYDSILEITDSRFLSNQSAWGGAASVRNNSTAVISQCDFSSNIAVQFPSLGGGVYCDHEAQVTLEHCTFVANSALYGGAVSADREAQVRLANCTLRANVGAYVGGGIYVKAASPVLERSIIAASSGRAVQCVIPGRVATLSACDLWANSGGNWDGQIENQRYLRRNFQSDPLFCGDTDQELAANSPCAAENNEIGLIGALGVGCESQDQGSVEAEPDTVLTGEPLLVSPNPFNPQTTVSFEVPAPGPVRVRVHDLRGAVIASLVDGVLPRGRHSVLWKGLDDRGRSVASGTYLVSVQTSAGLITRKILVAR